MNILDPSYEPHLTVREFSVLPSREWFPKKSEWSLVQVEEGLGYWLHAQSSMDLETGAVLLVSGDGLGRIRASQLGSMSLYSFSVTPSRLTGLITLHEQDLLKQAASDAALAFQSFRASSPIALKMKECCAGQNAHSLLFRLALLQLFVEIFAKKLDQVAPSPENGDARERLRAFLTVTAPDMLAEMNFDELARITRCTPRHLSRIFFDLVGMSFSEKRAEIRLVRARELLATSRSKVVEVAFESGYRSLSLFNQMFTRRFGISPGKWRQKNGVDRSGENRRNAASVLHLPRTSPLTSSRQTVRLEA